MPVGEQRVPGTIAVFDPWSQHKASLSFPEELNSPLISGKTSCLWRKTEKYETDTRI